MNKKGFTLVELLATIVIIALLAGIATVSYTSIVKQSSDRVFESYESTMHAEAVYKMTMHADDVTFTDGKATVEVTKSRVNGVLSMHYKVCLICSNYNSDASKCKDYEN